MAVTATALRASPAPVRNVAIDIRGVSHAFELDGSRLPVLESIDLSVAAGEFVALLTGGAGGGADGPDIALAAPFERVWDLVRAEFPGADLCFDDLQEFLVDVA